jgi:hypothetical protein
MAMEALHRSIFLKELKEAFPQLRDAINAQYGLLHLEVHAFTDFVQHAIADGDKETVRLSFMIAERYYNGSNADMSNAICVSFVEHLDLQKAPWAWDLLGPSLKQEYLQCIDVGMARPLPYLSAADRRNEIIVRKRRHVRVVASSEREPHKRATHAVQRSAD